MFKKICVVAAVLVINGCKTTDVNNDYTHLPVTQGELNNAKWNDLNRFPAKYPVKAVMASVEGCATVEYVITPDNEIKNMNVIASTSNYFNKAAKQVINQWAWSSLAKNKLNTAVKTQTRFDFCFDKPNQPCASLTPSYSCPGEDIIFSSGMRINVTKH
ncbi:energy transducer TonB [Pseudoalteromonas sp. MMG010]|uniref:TonB family protein n=1 Tax=Pseudoalteromonas sp. MMG010 TaxID=2822685 RepID=UPI001B3A3C02|nr:TonB family protein [Pseudoalteromonas sp. MMG010]MBQ4833671.1 energy transducer TonB [Pseudoalteromonas sp. MMG010]